jgi:hypothetical protein
MPKGPPRPKPALAKSAKRRKPPIKPVSPPRTHTAPAADRGGRPTLYTPELGQRICQRIIAGESLRQILLLPGMPGSRDTVYQWIARHKELADAYTAAKEIQAYVLGGGNDRYRRRLPH